MSYFKDLKNLIKLKKLQLRIKKYLTRVRSNISPESAHSYAQVIFFNFKGGTTMGLTSQGINAEKRISFANTNFVYKGQRLKGDKEGFGVQKWKDGALYMGQFKTNRANGLGIFKHSEGDEYKGEFYSDRARGFGIYKHSNGATYEGFWVDDCQDGLGEEKWCDNSKFVGSYEKGKKQGLGTYTWADGSRYEGEWYANCLHGFVIY